jgi:hypothetical protein
MGIKADAGFASRLQVHMYFPQRAHPRIITRKSHSSRIPTYIYIKLQ